MKKKRIVITGAAGMLGMAMCDAIAGPDCEIVETDYKERGENRQILDIRDWAAVRHMIGDFRPHLVLHLAAETDVDLCEIEPDHAFAVNAFGAENIARACGESTGEAVMVYISTGNVFSGEKIEPYTEYDRPAPVNVYGRSKLAGEEAIARILDRYYILRAGWMVGGWEIDKKFVYKIAQLCLTQKTLKVVDDKFGSPTFTVDFAANLIKVIASQRYGLYHMANSGTCSRSDIAKEIVKHLGMVDQVEIASVSSLHFPTPATRPRSEMLANFKLSQLGLDKMPNWRDSLERYILENKHKLLQ
jgi:dTDP-4-dehydrorhamnose reductase